MRGERANLGRLQRSRRPAVDEDVADHQDAVERWTAQAATVTESFAKREAWAREAAQLVAAGTPTLDPTTQSVGVDDLGMAL